MISTEKMRQIVTVSTIYMKNAPNHKGDNDLHEKCT